ncbi:MAG: UDP-N-acetylmuramoyl-tripeptide--D-alanyl-D-alanine ligase [Acidobacteriota bacterium]
MIEISIEEAIKATGARAKGSSRLEKLPPISIDSRTLQAGQCFVALKGERFDGHDFLEDVLRQGAAAIVCSQLPTDAALWTDRPLLLVEDTTRALQALGNYARRKWGKPLIAITGSMGKTTTREFTAALLGQKYHVFQSPGNFNNHFGLPFSLLQLELGHEIAVLELGMNHAGEIRALSRICGPDAAILTNVAEVHLEFFPDLGAIAEAKGEIIENLPPQGTLFYNADDPRVTRLAARHSGKKVSFGLENEAGVRIRSYDFTTPGEMQFEAAVVSPQWGFHARVPFAGKHFLYNVAAAVAVAVAFGVSREEVLQGLAQLKPLAMRGRFLQLSNEATVWDDSYNSNPQALRTVLDTVGRLNGFRRKILALGEMIELGPAAAELHRQAGRQISRTGACLLVTVGRNALHIAQGAQEQGFPSYNIKHFDDSEQAADFLSSRIGAGDFILVKGSRGTRMDRVVARLSGQHMQQ